jgi:hypothetical protein
MIALNAFIEKLLRANRAHRPVEARLYARDLQLAFALTQLLIDSGRADAAGAIVVATWQTRTHLVFEIICAERIRTPLCALLAQTLSRPFQGTADGWLLSQNEACALIELNAHARA